MSNRVLVIRGGAIGDFVLTLPAIRLLREIFPEAAVEILGYHSIVQLAEGRYYAGVTRSIDYAPLAGFFNPRAELDDALCKYFAGFQQVISYLYDPDESFAENLLRAGVRHLIQGSPKIGAGSHAACQLARPLERLALFLKDPAARLFPSSRDERDADNILNEKGIRSPFFVVHPGSGGKHKNWPISRWEEFCLWILQDFSYYHLVCAGGEADGPALEYLAHRIQSPRLVFLDSLSLPILAAVFSKARGFVGHDTGISHVAAAAGAPCLLLYGPTDPEVWAPANHLVHVLTSPTGFMEDLPLETVREAFESLIEQEQMA